MTNLAIKIRKICSAIEDELFSFRDYALATSVADDVISAAAGRLEEYSPTVSQARRIKHLLDAIKHLKITVDMPPELPITEPSNEPIPRETIGGVVSFTNFDVADVRRIERLRERQERHAAERAAFRGSITTVTPGPFSAIVRYLQESSERFASITDTFPNGDRLRFALVGARGRIPGSINVTNGLAFGEDDNLWYGRITVDGQFHRSADLPRNINAPEIMRQMVIVADRCANP
jgi:hypothetical protein